MPYAYLSGYNPTSPPIVLVILLSLVALLLITYQLRAFWGDHYFMMLIAEN